MTAPAPHLWAQVPLPPLASVYGTRLATHSEWAHWAPRMSQPPHQRAPSAPVAYLKPANTFGAEGATVRLAQGASEVEVGASLGLVLKANWPAAPYLTAQDAIECIALCNDWQLPHDSLYRPPVRFNAWDGALGLCPQAVAAPAEGIGGAWLQWRIDIQINDRPVGQWAAADLIHPPTQTLQRMSAFTQWAAHDMLLLGCSWPRPRARVGDVVTLVAHVGAHTLRLSQSVQAAA